MSSSGSSSSSSSSTVSSKINELNKKKIVSCALGISKIKGYAINGNFVHAALLLIDTDCGKGQRGDGILIEYGNYCPKMDENEFKKVQNKDVIYRYDEKGGLRYYVINYDNFVKEFGDLCYVDMDIDNNRRVTFQYFIDTIAPKTEYKWIKNRYNVNPLEGFLGKGNHHCQIFSAEALKILKPSFRPKDIAIVGAQPPTNKIDILPGCIKKVLLKYLNN